MLRGMSTVSFYAADLEGAKRWYTEFLGFEPYFNRPGYIEWRIGDFQHELGIIDAKYAREGWANGPAGEVVHWAVDDLEATLDRLKDLGATEYQGITEHGEGFVTASVVDPFGNILGIMFNQHYLDTVTAVKG